MRAPSVVSIFVLAVAIAGNVYSQDFIPRRQNQLPGPPLTPDQAIAKMTVPEGFHVELVASEPDLLNPVAMAFDDRGRIWVTESFEYPRHEPGPGKDRVKILEDTDGDGKVDSVKIFAEGLNIPSGIAIGHGGVWVANAPDILFLEDTDGDDRADKSTVVVTGFGRDDTHELPNALTWGPDGYLYGLNGVFNRSVVKQDDRVYDFTCAMFRIDPRTKRFDLFCEGTSNPWGIAFDPEGSAFISACVIDHLWHLTESAYYLRQGGPYPPHTWWANSIVKHQHQMAAYCGIEYFDSPAYPKQYRDKLYMGNIHGGCINVDRVERSGATYQGFGEPDFMTANDVWFMPVAQKVGPDGCLYVLDWYDRYHCYQDASADPKGVDRGHGRLYRVVYDKRPAITIRDIAKLSNLELLELLKNNNIYYRQRAQLELSERRAGATDSDVRTKLETIALDESADLKTRMHAIWAISGSGLVDNFFAYKLLKSPKAEVRAWAVRIVGNEQKAGNEILAQLDKLASDTDARVRLQVAIAAPKIHHLPNEKLRKLELLAKVLKSSSNDPILPNVVWQNMFKDLPEHQDWVVKEILSNVDRQDDLLSAMAPRIATRLLAEVKPKVDDDSSRLIVQTVLAIAKGLASAKQDLSADVLRALLSRVRTGEVSVEAIRPLLDAAGDFERIGNAELISSQLGRSILAIQTIRKIPNALARCREFVVDRKMDAGARREMLQLLVQVDSSSAAGPLALVLDDLVKGNGVDPGYRDMVLDLGIARTDDAGIANVVKVLPKLSTDMQAAIAERMCQRENSAVAVLEQVVQGVLRKELFSPNRVRLLANGKSDSMKTLVAKIWGTVNTESSQEREAVIRKVADKLRWDARGNAERGWVVYDRICGQCHVMHNRGNEVGPNITLNGRGSYDQLLVSVFNPSLVIGDAYKSVTIRTEDGTVITGLLVDRNDQRTVVKVQGGKEQTVSNSEIEEFRRDTKSLMPEGIETQLSDQELADLFALLTLEKAPDVRENAKISGTPEFLHQSKK